MKTPTPESLMEILVPLQQVVEQIAAIRPIMLKTLDGWETITHTDLLLRAVQRRDAVWQQMFEALGDHFEV